MNGYCWACWHDGDNTADCHRCGAPAWNGRYFQRHAPDVPGVYVLRAENGMAKVGVSRKSIAVRVRPLLRRAERNGTPCEFVTCMLDAGIEVERWLHGVLADTRDESTARDDGLPNPTEWFWPTPALRALINGRCLMDWAEPGARGPHELEQMRRQDFVPGEVA